MAILTIENLTFSYPEQTVRAIDDLTLTVPEGAFVARAGPSRRPVGPHPVPGYALGAGG